MEKNLENGIYTCVYIYIYIYIIHTYVYIIVSLCTIPETNTYTDSKSEFFIKGYETWKSEGEIQARFLLRSGNP